MLKIEQRTIHCSTPLVKGQQSEQLCVSSSRP